MDLPVAAGAAERTGQAPAAPTNPVSWSFALPDGLYCIITVWTPFHSVWHKMLSPMCVVTALYE